MAEPVSVFNARIDGCSTTFESASEANKYMAYCESIKDGSEVEIVVRKRKKHRSNQQNAYYWGVVIKMIADETGEDDLETIHGVLAAMFLKVVGPMGKEFVRSTASLSTVEFEEYAESCRRWASIALGLYIPLPNEAEIPEYYKSVA